MDNKGQRRGRRLADEQLRHADLDPDADCSLIVVGHQKNREQVAKRTAVSSNWLRTGRTKSWARLSVASHWVRSRDISAVVADERAKIPVSTEAMANRFLTRCANSFAIISRHFLCSLAALQELISVTLYSFWW